MTLPNQKLREIVLQMLFSSEFALPEGEAIAFLMEQNAITKKNAKHAFEKSQLIWEKIKELDEKIAENSSAYELDRIPRLELSVLRLGIYEIFYDQDIPPVVAIHEAMRLSRKYATSEAVLFVNAVLDGAYQKSKVCVPLSI